ncbi:MAG TPA: LCP family protein [Ilumatobacter sp.]|jgi:LCP family protein required for cell wall assembly|nr:LCP family protein [Ilumatobacter sp.]
MSGQTDAPALDRLRRFEHEPRPAGETEPPAGSPGAQMATSIVLPGLPTIRRVPLLGVLLFTIGVAIPIVLAAWVFARRDDIVTLALEPRFLTAVTVVGCAIVLTRLLAVAEVAHAFRRSSGIAGRTVVATLVVLAMAVPVLLLSLRANQARTMVASVFGEGGPALYVPQQQAVDPGAVTNILLLGGDAGPGRWGLRTDTMILVSVNDATGRTALVSIPRNLTRLQFPPGSPLAAEYPNGFDDLANAVFPHVSANPELTEHYGRSGRQPEAVALSEAVGYSLDVEIDDYALVNMQGFTEIIDSVGGVTLELFENVPLPPSLPGEHPLPSSIGPGQVTMDGATAIAYARSRSADSDYQRMGRQRQLLAALGSQISATEAVSGFGSVTGALADSMRTSLSAGEFASLLDRLGDNAAIGESVGLVPPLVEPGNPDYAQIRTIIDAVERFVVTGEPSGYAG